MTAWQDLDQELAAWQKSGRCATLWWRDDDASEPSPALERLLRRSETAGVPLSLAVIPARTGAALAERLSGCGPSLQVLQHGFSHTNHAPAGRKKMELGPERSNVAVCKELALGRAILGRLFAARSLPVLVPPWNRLPGALVADLPGLGFRGLSRHGPRATVIPVKDIIECNTHVDLLRWRPERGFVGEDEALGTLIGHLAARRRALTAPDCSDGTDPREPSGLLTHHLVMDDAAWAFVERLFGHLSDHGAVRWLTAREAFAPGAAD